MPNGANSVHKDLRTELENYIKSQYFAKTPILLSAVSDQLDDEGVLYQKPYIESSPAYKVRHNGIQSANIPNWMKNYFLRLSTAGVGVYPSPFVHQINALEAACEGKDLFVATGTGSGKTECFMWPLLAKLEMQQFCPDILITNYSMLEYMLLRPREAKMWNDTKDWLESDPKNKLLFVIDEAHMYRGSSGGEVALLIRRLFHKLGITRDVLLVIICDCFLRFLKRV